MRHPALPCSVMDQQTLPTSVVLETLLFGGHKTIKES